MAAAAAAAATRGEARQGLLADGAPPNPTAYYGKPPRGQSLEQHSCPCERYQFCGSFKFCLGEIKANGKTVVGEVQDQGELSQCVVYSYAKAVEIIERVSKVAEGTDPDLVDCIDPMDLHNKFDEKFPEVLSVDCLTRDFGLHRVLHTGLILRSEGAIKLESGKRYIASDVSTIPRDDFERICHNLAEGIPLIATYIAGERRSHLRYCQIYKAPPQFGPDGKRLEQLGHAVVLIGAGMKRGRRFFYFMSSWGEKFCPRKNKQGEIVTSGIGKLRETDLTKNVVRLSLPSETGQYGLRALITKPNRYDSICTKPPNPDDEMGTKMDELEQSVNDLKAEMGTEVPTKKVDEAKPADST
uniref:Peptidase C1A papain C-terminal domain-containing protein n=1 Tax=Leersia perrieri TaxID=77586 RepID=A0A0D9XHD3_9ORYZ